MKKRTRTVYKNNTTSVQYINLTNQSLKFQKVWKIKLQREKIFYTACLYNFHNARMKFTAKTVVPYIKATRFTNRRLLNKWTRIISFLSAPIQFNIN